MSNRPLLLPTQPASFWWSLPGRPVPWQRMLTAGKRRYKSVSHEAHEDALQAITFPLFRRPIPAGVPIQLGAAFMFPLPKGKRSRRHPLPVTPRTGTPDLSNLVKIVEDSLNAMAWHDDAQIVGYLGGTGKFYCAQDRNEPRTVIRVQWNPDDVAAAEFLSNAGLARFEGQGLHAEHRSHQCHAQR